MIIRADKCDCVGDECKFGTDPDYCVMKMDGDIQTKYCPTCCPNEDVSTWHQDGECLCCRWKRRLQ